MNNKSKKIESANKQKMRQLRKFWRSTEREGGVTKSETGITGFDQMLEGGLPEGRATLISAGPGCGKTVLLSEFLYRGATEHDETGIFVTFEERPEDILFNLRNFDWDINTPIAHGKLHFLDGSPPETGEIAVGPAQWLEPTLAQIQHLVETTGAKRMAIDNLGTVFLRYLSDQTEASMRNQLVRFANGIKRLGLTTMISTERTDSQASLSHYGMSEFVADGLIELNIHAGPVSEIRTMHVSKLRGCGFRSGKVGFEITSDGLKVFPKIPIDSSLGETDFSQREAFGIEALDEGLDGGIPRGHIMLVTGNTGTGKSTLGLHFCKEGLAQGQGVVWVALEEPVGQVMKTAHAHEWDLSPGVQSGQLTFVTTSLLEVNPDKLLYDVIDAVETIDARRIIVDSVSSLESATMNQENVREFMMQLAGYSKTLGITTVMNYLTGESFAADKEQLLGLTTTNAMRLSSIVDGVMLLRFVEREQAVHKLLNILKLRGSAHDKGIMRYEIDKDGFILGQKFTS